MTKKIRAALYVRVSTGAQSVENQIRDLQIAAEHRGWEIVATYADEGISGSKGRDKRPGLDKALKEAVRGKFDVLMAWSVDRIGRSLADLVASLQTVHGAHVDLFLHQQAIDTTTPAGKAMFGMLGVFAEFERAMIQERVKAGLAVAVSKGVKLGRKTVGDDVEATIAEKLREGHGILKVSKMLGVGSSTVQRVKATMTEAA